jgi:DNA polymerase III alpha subunit
MYLKINYPYEFFCVLLSKNASDFKGLSEHIADAKNHCIKINKPSLFHSKAIFNIVDQQIYYSFNAIKGIGDETAKQIEALLNQYVKYDLIHLIMFLSKNKLTKSIIEKLLLAGTFDSIFEKDHDVFYYLFNLDEIIKSAISLLPSGEVIIEPDFRDPTFSQAEKNNYLKIKKDLLPEGL